ncbi:molybdate ABC transporter substrate-binding protein [Janthinobacterium agaricidamnosum]|uniref:Molybdate ABC transporter, periplasmic molybdate-binding protein n=1 Tax=Janthinobacterium agaricidamnosum NBRC 102515 = DSM 9628 TaxID=1349767 RepID=W0VEA6_9BURK|nr:molybdate ABC transporter substrate-binding protein [Janthinobacterium agaricidamnosum]CDG86020.1 molybdate ABC transporter, periplasmic molybdate-binding protein [Janthinobacterium agaricidamnosum NBRC 102515 = DSM 9628]
MRLHTLAKLLSSALLVSAASSAMAGELVVSAAASLTNAFKDAAASYEAQHPGTRISLNFAASGTLLQQIAKGAPVDVFASADQETMDAAQKQGLVTAAERRDFVSNSLVLIVPGDSKLGIKSLASLGQPTVTRVAIANPASVPVGRYSEQALRAAKLWDTVQPKAISTQNVRQSLDYVARGEVDAGFVYGTDAAIMKDKVHVVLTVPLETPVRYPVASLKASTHSAEAKSFVDFILSAPAQAIFAKYGFEKP